MPAFEFDNQTFNNPVELTLHLVGGNWKMPRRVEYALTPLGETVLPCIDVLRNWGAEYLRQQT